MLKLRYGLIALCMLICSVTSADAQVSIGIGLPNVSIGINLPLFPDLVPVPGYPVYYAPRLEANYFFYDGLYWVFQDDNWYASSWYNGPWWIVDPYDVPLFILRIPVRYYRQPPVYFRGWRESAPPRWGRHWGRDWEQRRRGWSRWDRGSAPRPAPLPLYQRRYSGERYPRVEQQQTLRSRNYRYQPRETIVRRHYGQHPQHMSPTPVPRARSEGPPARGPGEQDFKRSGPPERVRPAGPPPQPPSRGNDNIKGPTPVQPTPRQQDPAFREQRRQPGAYRLEQQSPGPQGRVERSQERKMHQEPGHGRGQGEMKGEERDRERRN